MTEELANTSDKRKLNELSKREVEALFDEIDRIEDDDEAERRYEELHAKWEKEYRESIAYMQLPKELEDGMFNADTLRQFIPAYWRVAKYRALKDAEKDFAVGRKRKLEIDRNSATAQAGVGFLCVLTILSLDTQSTYLDLSFYVLCFVTPLLVARAYALESSLRDGEKPSRSLISLRHLVLGAIESVGLGVGILGLIAHYSEIAAATMAVGAVAAAVFTLVPMWSEKSEKDSGK